MIYAAISNYGISLLNSDVPTRLNHPPFPAVDITVSSIALFWSFSWFPLNVPHGSDHLPVIIEHIVSTSHSIYEENTSPQFNFYKPDWDQLCHVSIHLLTPSYSVFPPFSTIYNNFVSILSNSIVVLVNG